MVNLCAAKSATDGWGRGMGGFLLILFRPPLHEQQQQQEEKKSQYSTLSICALRPSNSSGSLLSKTHSTLSICALLVFTTFLFFTLSTFDPSNTTTNNHPRRIHGSPPPFKPALQGMGLLYRRGTRAMSDLVVAHVSHSVHRTQFRTFLRIIHTSGLLARSDLAFIFSSPSVSSKFSPLIIQENHSFLELLLSFNNRTTPPPPPALAAGFTRYLTTNKRDREYSRDAIWGKGAFLRPTNFSDYGSVVGFDASELDPENSLSGFMDQAVPMGLRRWACYPMLLGRLRRTYKHMALADPHTLLLLNDPFARLRNRTPESVFVWSTHHPDSESAVKRAGKRRPQIHPGIVVGGSRGVRHLTDAVLTQIVRAVIDHKGRKSAARFNSLTADSAILNQLLVCGAHLLRNVNLIAPPEPLPNAAQLFGSDPSSSGSLYTTTVLQWEHTSSLNFTSLWCWSDLHSVVYSDCLPTQS